MKDNNLQPLVSVLIPMYNQERYIDACMQSVCMQTYKNLEIIVTNDGSTDRSPQKLRNWASRDSRIKVIDKKNEGLPFARRDGYLEATGDFVTCVDSDDLLPPKAIEVLVKCVVENNVDLVNGSTMNKLGPLRRDSSSSRYQFPFNKVIRQPELFDRYYVGFFSNKIFPISIWGRIYRKSCIDRAYCETELFSTEIRYMGEDHFFNVKLFPYLNSMYRTSEYVYIYRFGGGTAHFNSNFPSLFWFCDMRLKLLDQYAYKSGYEPLFEEYIACLYYHAAQLLHYKKADKAGVIDFFRQEVEKRELMPRFKSYYTKNGIPTHEMKLLINEDYEGMYQYTCKRRKEIFCSLSHKLRHSMLWVLNNIG